MHRVDEEHGAVGVRGVRHASHVVDGAHRVRREANRHDPGPLPDQRVELVETQRAVLRVEVEPADRGAAIELGVVYNQETLPAVRRQLAAHQHFVVIEVEQAAVL